MAEGPSRPFRQPPEQINIIVWMIMLICSLPPLRPNGFVNLFVFSEGTRRNLQLGKEPPRAPAAREAAPGTISGGALPPRTPPFFFRGFWEGGDSGPFWVDVGLRMCRFRQLLDDYVNLFGGYYLYR